MSSELLKQVMDKLDASPEDITSATKVSTATIKRYLKGQRISRALEFALKRWIEERSNLQSAS